MIARVADHCFWLGRYIERTESTARVLQATETLALDAELPPRRCWHPVVIVSGQEADCVDRFGSDALGNAEVVQRYLALDEENPVSMRRSVIAARENARSIREVISLDVWQVMNELHVFLCSEEAVATYEIDRDALYARVQRSTQLILGLLRSTMLHDAPLDFVWLGVLLERVGQTARLLDVQYHALIAEGCATSVGAAKGQSPGASVEASGAARGRELSKRGPAPGPIRRRRGVRVGRGCWHCPRRTKYR